MARTDTLANYITDISNAVREVTGETETIKANELDTKIRGISSGSKFAPRWIRFSYYTGTDLDYEVANLDTSNMESMQVLFSSLTGVETLDLSGFNTSNVKSMYAMFNKSTGLKNINFSGFNTANVTTMYGMFQGCSGLVSLDLSSFDTTNVDNMAYMFDGCTSLTSLNINNFDFTLNPGNTNMFNSVPTNCEIIVKDDTAKTWITSNFTTLTNVKTVAELGGE